MRAASLLAALAVVPAAAEASARPGSRGFDIERESFLMGTRCIIAGVHDTRAAGLEAIEAGFAAIRETEALLSTWRQDTPLARLVGAVPDEPQKVPAELARLLGLARQLWRETGGAFDPAIAELVAAWDLRGSGRVPTAADLAAARARSGMAHVQVDTEASTVTLRRAGLGFDAGAFGKGVGLAAAKAALETAGLQDWWIDFGGQVLVAATGPEREIPVAHPAARSRTAAWLRLRGLSAATSSASERPGHILDPRSGRPAADFGSVTVLAADPIRADALATALYVLGPVEGLALADRLQGIEALFMVGGADGWSLRATPGAVARLTRREGSAADLLISTTRQTHGSGTRPGPVRPAAREPLFPPCCGVAGPAFADAAESTR